MVHHLLNDLERFGSKPLDFKGFLDIMTAKMGERDTKEDRHVWTSLDFRVGHKPSRKVGSTQQMRSQTCSQ